MTISGNITQLLRPEFQQAGYSLTEDEDFIEVHYKGKQIGTFSKHNRKDLSAIEKFIAEQMFIEVQKLKVQ